MHSANRISEIDKTFSSALTYFLYCDLFSGNARKLFLRQIYLFSQPLRDLIQCLKSNGARSELIDGVPMGRRLSIREYARILCDLFEIQKAIIESNSATHRQPVPSGCKYSNWASLAQCRIDLDPVRKIRELVCSKRSLFHRVLLHGSVATLDYEPGFSDLDLAIVLRDSVFADPSALVLARREIRKIVACSLLFDPDMHHGPYILWESKFGFYREDHFPSVLFKHGCELIDNSSIDHVNSIVDPKYSINAIEEFDKFFSSWIAGRTIQNRFEVEWVLGSVMLLPTLFLQCKTGKYRYKRETFRDARPFFSDEIWNPIEIASEIRRSLPPRGGKPNILGMASINLALPELILLWSRDSSASKACAASLRRRIDKTYFQSTKRLINNMLTQIDRRSI